MSIKMKFLPLLLVILALASAKEEEKPKKKPFGLKHGPTYIGGSDVRHDGVEFVNKINEQYRTYRVLQGLETPDEKAYYEKWMGRDLCEAGCATNAECNRGICNCPEGYLQIFGQCNDAQWVSVSQARSDVRKFRKPPDPVKPETCFKTVYDRDREGKRVTKKIIKEEMLDVPACKTPPFIKRFDPAEQNCTNWKPCNEKDVNLICNQAIDRCECRPGTKWNTRTMECQIYLDVNCVDITVGETPNEAVIEAIKSGNTANVGSPKPSTDEIRIAFCYLLDGEAEEYLKNKVDESDFYILGLSVGAFLATCLGSICAACCCCKCCNSVREKIRRLDPRTRFAEMDQTTQMAALGTLAAGEYLDRKEERDDEYRAAQIQGQAAAPGVAPGYGAPPAGYAAPAAPGYGAPAAPGYGSPAGYAPVPTAPGGVYPPPQGGIVPPQPSSGLMSHIPSAAPEALLAGAGLYTGNKEMTALGVAGAIDKVNMGDDKDHQFRMAAVKGAPPPPMGYAGGPALPQQGSTESPLANANYPRQS